MHQLRESSRAVSQSGLSPAHHRNITGLPEAKASGKCNDLRSVMILGPLDRGHSNWDIGTASNHPITRAVSAECRIELKMILGRLQVQYDLSAV